MVMKESFYILFILLLIISCNNKNENQYPKKIGINKISSVVKGDSAKNEINAMHQLVVSAEEYFIVYYGENDTNILYVSKFEGIQESTIALENMLTKMRSNKNIPFTNPIPMKKYNNKSFMSLGLGSVHYIYQSGKYLLWLSTKQKFYNELPKDLVKIYSVNQ
jgi:hypothetical protein